MAMANQTDDEAKQRSSVEALPPFQAMAAVYRDRLRMMKTTCLTLCVVALGLLVLQEIRFHGALGKYTNREILIVPGAVDFMRVRPNVLPENVVYYFAEYIAEAVGTFSYQNVEAKAQRVGEFFTPQFRERYLAALRRNLGTYRELNVTEVLTPQPATKYQLVKDGDGTPHYVVNVRAKLERYSGDNRLLTEDEVVTIKFRTTRVVPDKPWFFEVEEITRRSVEEFEHEKDARERLAQ